MSIASRYRREGRNAYCRGGIAVFSCPYDFGTRRTYWLEGWEEEGRQDEIQQREESEQECRRNSLAHELVSIFPEWGEQKAKELSQFLITNFLEK